MSFNLLTSDWIPVLASNGRAEVSLRDALVGSSRIHGLDFGNPLVGAAITRLLLAVVLDAIGGIPSAQRWREVFEAGEFDESRLDSYFEQYRDRFELFDGPLPFYQAPGLEPASGDWKSVTLLLPEIATGNNVPLFASVLESTVEPLVPSEAARRLVACHAWDTAAIKTGAVGDPQVKQGKTTGNPVGALGQLGVVLPEGRNLFESLILAAPVTQEYPADLPAWRRDWTAEWTVRQPRGILDLLTWQSRRIRLVGGEAGVTGVLVAAGDRMDFVPPHLEPHTAWRVDSKAEVSHRPKRHTSGRSAWRGMDALLASDAAEGGAAAGPGSLRNIGSMSRFMPEAYPLGVMCVGVEYGNQSAVIENVTFDRVPMPLRALEDTDGYSLTQDLVDAVETAERLRRLINDLQGNIRRACGGDKIPWDKGDHPGDAMMAAFDEPTRRLLGRLQEAPAEGEETLENWRATVRQLTWGVGSQLLDAAPVRAISGQGDRADPFTLARAEIYFRSGLKKLFPDKTEERV